MLKLGLIAGSGRFPLLFAEEARRMHMEVCALGIKGLTDPALEKMVGKVQYFKLGQLDKPIKALREEGITQVVMAGKVQHASLFGGIMPDLRAAKLLTRLPDRRTDTILKAVANEFSKDGIELLPSSTYLSHLLVTEGVLTSRKPHAAEIADIKLGWRAAKALAGFDIGQTVVVKDGAVIAVEGMEGTDACILRARDIANSQGKHPQLAVVKVGKPNQDMRFDIPVLGLDSIAVFSQARVCALALEAGSAIIFDKDAFLQQADEKKIAIVGYKNPEGAPS
ncbi:MAG: hypothetical protein A3J74_09795 [Elusimicrobia bacterium RIFCSPHIGHO2_02_FULL_57_9]|nr:MAG: hypothetical protein A3J74_09795 [Elusimicrobia bacterium RIFCSPHIGHO2_02_FULL_57_9]